MTFGPIFRGVRKWHFSDFKMHFWGFGVPGLCSTSGRLQVQRLWGPLEASEFDPSFQQFGGGPGEALQGPLCSFSTEWENKVGHSEAPKRSHFHGCPLRGFQPSGSYPWATDQVQQVPAIMGQHHAPQKLAYTKRIYLKYF